MIQDLSTLQQCACVEQPEYYVLGFGFPHGYIYIHFANYMSQRRACLRQELEVLSPTHTPKFFVRKLNVRNIIVRNFFVINVTPMRFPGEMSNFHDILFH